MLFDELECASADCFCQWQNRELHVADVLFRYHQLRFILCALHKFHITLDRKISWERRINEQSSRAVSSLDEDYDIGVKDHGNAHRADVS